MAKQNTAPRYTSIMGQPHMLAYINSDEEKLLRSRGGMGIAGPAGIKAYPPGSSGYGSGEGTGYSGTTNDTSDNDDGWGGGWSNSGGSVGGTSYPDYGPPGTGSGGSGGPGGGGDGVGQPYVPPSSDNDGGSGSSGSGNTNNDDNIVDNNNDGIDDNSIWGNETPFIDPYEYNDLIMEKNPDGTWKYSDTAAYDLSSIDPNEVSDSDYQRYEALENQYYVANPTSNISDTQYTQQKKVARILGAFVGPLGLGFNIVTEMQRKGILPGPMAGVEFLPREDVPAVTNSDRENRINEVLNDENLTDEEQQDAVQDILTEDAIAAGAEKLAAEIKILRDGAYGANETLSPDDVIEDPSAIVGTNTLADQVPTIDADTEGTNLDADAFTQPDDDIEANVSTVGDSDITTASSVTDGTATGYTANEVSDKLDSDFYTAEGATGEVSDEAVVDAEQIDVEKTEKGLNAVGRALNDFARIDISRVIDTTTVQGKLLADKLGEGGYVDSKATILGQMKIISDEFKDSNGNPKIPAWAQGLSRNVSKTIAFKGMSGTAATAAVTNAMMEASLGVAEKEAAFFQTLTTTNLNNRQEAVINKANVLANFEMKNLDARMEAAVTNAQSFLKMDLANLDHKQQAEIVNTQVRVDALLEDSKAVNAARLFRAEAENDFTKYYDNLNAQIEMHTAEQKNAMERFNTGELNDNAEFNATLEQRREEFYKDMQYNVELANARWRQDVTLKETEMAFEAAKTDLDNLISIKKEALTQLWDREDALLDYTWKAAESELNRDVERYKADRNYDVNMSKINMEKDQATGAAWFEGLKWVWDVGDGLDWW